ncbi:MAG: amino acid adenylation domain-containing protein [Vicinamibacterales bacterium]
MAHTLIDRLSRLSAADRPQIAARLSPWLEEGAPSEPEDVRRLVAFVVPKEGALVDAAELLEFLRSRLQRQAVPSDVVALSELPRLAGGKVDRLALERLPLMADGGAAREAIGSPIEQILHGLWCEILQIERLGRDDDFLAAGGHSLLATRLVTRTRRSLGVQLTVRDLFDHPTLRAFATHVEARRRRDAVPLPPLTRMPREGRLPLSIGQRRLWVVSQVDPEAADYNCAMPFRLVGRVDAGALERALTAIIERHEVLRTVFVTERGQPEQVVVPAARVRMPVIDLRWLPPAERDCECQRRLYEQSRRPFDLRHAPLLRAALFRTGDDEHVFLLVVHHIACDGWSGAILARELSTLYAAARRGAAPALPPLPVQYADYAAWQHEVAATPLFDRQLDYWARQLADVPTLVGLPFDRARPAVRSGNGATMRVELPEELVERLRPLAREAGTTVFVTLLAAFNVLLHRYSGQTDIVVGTDFAGRGRQEVEPLLGFFVNQLALRTELAGAMTFRDAVQRVHDTALAAYDNADVPFDQVVERLRPERTPGINPLIQIDFTLHDFALADVVLPGAAASPLAIDIGVSRFDLEINLHPDGGRIAGTVQYDTDLFDAATVERLLEHYDRVLDAASREPRSVIADIPLVDEGERAQLAGWNATAREFPLDRPLIDLVLEQASRTPDAVAAVFGAEVATYAELARRAASIGSALRARGAGPDELVAVLAHRSIAFLATILGIFQARAAYLPLDPRQPPARHAQILRESGARLLAVAPELEDLLGTVDTMPDACVERLEVLERAVPARWHSQQAATGDLAYVMFTSGSTGVPKGAMVDQVGMVNHLFSKVDALGLTNATRLAQTAAQWFDISVWQFLAPLLVGGQVHIIDDATVRDPRLLHRALEDADITVAEVVPSLLRPLIDELSDTRGTPLPALQWMIATGESLSPELTRLWLRRCPGVPLLNAYGPTECSDDVTHAVIADPPPLTQLRMPIGRPLPNMRVHVLDGAGNQQPIGATGELHVGGVGVGRGYLHDAEATATAFLPDPLGDRPGRRLYRTGDLGRLRSDGEIEFVGRDDDQVKVRGYRIELGEIEAVLEQHTAVREAVVTVREDEPGKPQLVGYIVPRGSDELADAGGGDWQAERVSAWHEIFEDTYRTEVAGQDPLFVGWNSSYTGKPMSDAEMEEWRDWTVAAVLGRRPTAVLEIGCGTGLLLARIAPTTNRYWGTDFSPHAIEQLSARLEATGPLPQVRLLEREAADFSGIPRGGFDGVILNSVVQYFPHVEYLVNVLRGAVDALAPGGFMFVGDVRHYGLLRTLHTSIELSNAPDDLPVSALRERIGQRMLREEELLIHPRFFHAFRREVPRVTGLAISLKRGSTHNELTRARYQVILEVDTPPAGDVDIQWIRCAGDVAAMGAAVRAQLADGAAAVGIRGVPNARLERDVVAADWLVRRPLPTAGEVRAALEHVPPGVDPEVFWALAADVAADVHVVWSDADDGRYDVVFTRPGVSVRDSASAAAEPAAPWASYTSNPLQGKFAARLAPQLRQFVADRLPEQMVPSALVMLDALPMTANGKLNRRALPAPAVDRPDVGEAYVGPRTVLERRLADIWSELLRVKRIGVRDNFFALGGHSLIAIQVISRIRNALGVHLDVRTIFERQTIEAIAERVEAMTAEAGACAGRRRAGLPVELLRKGPKRQHWNLAAYQLPEWYLHELAPESAFYNICLHLVFTGDLSVDGMARAWQMLVDRHGVLRMTFTTVDGRPVMRVADRLPITLQDLYVDRRNVPEAEWRDDVQRILEEVSATVLDFERGPLFRVRLVELPGRRHLLVFLVHHIIWDETSTMILWRELAECYNALRQDRAPKLPRLEFEYTDFAESVDLALESGRLEDQRRYWLDQFASVPDPLDVPADFPRPPIQSFRGDDLRHDFSPELSQALEAFAKSQNATLYIALLAVLNLWIHRLTGREDFVVGSPIANRDDERIESMMGLFATALPMRAAVNPTMTFEDLLRRTRDVAIAAYDNHAYPSILAIQEIGPPMDGSRNRLFSVMYGLQNEKTRLTVDTRFDGDVEIASLHDVVTADARTAPFDLTLIVDYARDHIFVRFQYSTDLFRRETVGRFARQLDGLVSQVVRDAGRPLVDYEIMDASERAAALERSSGPVVAIPSVEGVHALVEAQARRHADAVAVQSDDTALTYRELVDAFTAIAARLLQMGVGPEERIGVVMEPSPAAAAAVLGVLKAGAAYVAIAPRGPSARRRAILAAAGARIVLAADGEALDDVGEGRTVVRVGRRGKAPVTALPATWPRVELDRLAYVIFTSGTTGVPKGIQIAHRGIVNLLAATERVHPLHGGDVVLGVTPLGFDASVIDLFWPVAHGVRAISAPSESATDPFVIARLIRQHGVTIWECVPTVLEGVVSARGAGRLEALPSLRLVMCGGAPLRSELAREFRRLFPDSRLANHYGPSEVTVDATALIDVEADRPDVHVPIGRPLDNTRVYVLDAQRSPVPPQVPGEIYVGSPGLARGYLADAPATADAFVPDPFSPQPGARMYRTGDRGRFDDAGRLHCLGRLDGQVKVQGNRVELGDVEAAIASHPAVVRCHVAHRATAVGGDQLIAWVELRRDLAEVSLTPEGIRQWVGEKLPAYMVPTWVSILGSLPLTTSNKVDRRALEAVMPSGDGRDAAPSTDVQRRLYEIWRRVLRRDNVGVTGNFFALGGHSILATEMLALANTELGTTITLRQLFSTPTIVGLERLIGTPPAGTSGLALGSGPDRAVHEANRLSWNAATRVHNSHKADQAAFFRAGGTTLFDEECQLLGDVTGRRLVHLLCNAGQDTISLARLGTSATVGVDISDVAIAEARDLARAVGADITFVRSDVYDWLAEEAARGGEYDVAVMSYGALCWLSDLRSWAHGMARILPRGGRFVGVDFHPVVMMFDDAWRMVHGYFGSAHPVESPGVTDYVAEAADGLVPWGFRPGITDFVNPHPDFTYQWSLGEILTALLGVGFQITRFEEYRYCNGAPLLKGMRRLSDRRFGSPAELPELPLMFGVVAQRT